MSDYSNNGQTRTTGGERQSLPTYNAGARSNTSTSARRTGLSDRELERRANRAGARAAARYANSGRAGMEYIRARTNYLARQTGSPTYEEAMANYRANIYTRNGNSDRFRRRGSVGNGRIGSRRRS